MVATMSLMNLQQNQNEYVKATRPPGPILKLHALSQTSNRSILAFLDDQSSD